MMEKPIDWQIDSEGCVVGVNLSDGYFYGVVQYGSQLIIYAKTAEDEARKITLTGLSEMNVNDFWIGSIIGAVYVWPLNQVGRSTWERLFAGRIASHDYEANLQKLLKSAQGKHFFALESTYGGTVLAVCDDMKITSEASCLGKQKRG
jgi:hypothetical protein